MTKKSGKRPTENEKGRENSVWSWKNIFGFRRSQTTRKKSSDKRNVNNHIGIVCKRNETNSLNRHNGTCQWTLDGEKPSTASGDSKSIEKIVKQDETTKMPDKEKQNVEILTEEEKTNVQEEEEPTLVEEEITSGQEHDIEEPTQKVLMKEEMSNGLGTEKESVEAFTEEELTGGQKKEKEHSFYVVRENMEASPGKEKDPSVQALMDENTDGGHDKENEHRVLLFKKEEIADWQDKAKEPSVKKLGQKEVTGQQDKEKLKSYTRGQAEEPRSVHGGQKKKSTGSRKKYRRKTGSTEVHDVSAYEDFSLTFTQDSNKISLKDYKIDNIMEEFCHQIHRRSIKCKKHDQNEGLSLGESIKEFIHQKLKDIDQCIEEKLMDAFDVLSLEEELFLKLIEDPDSPLKKSLRYWKGTLADRNRKSDFSTGSNFSENKSSYSRKSEDLSNHKQMNFFRRMVKSEDRNLLKEDINIHASNRTVTLKPRSTSSPGPDTESGLRSSLESHCDVNNERVGSYFFFTKLGGIIRNAIKRERSERTSRSTENRFPVEYHNSGDGDKTNQDDSAHKNSPIKFHSFFRRLSRYSTHHKRDDNRSKDCDIVKEKESASNSRNNDFKFNIKAKRHLSKKMSRVHRFQDLSTQHVSATLGTILSLSENNKRDFEYILDQPLENSDHDNFKTMSENTQLFKKERFSYPEISDQLKVEESTDSKLQSTDTTPNIEKELTFDDTVETRCPKKKESKIDVKAKKHMSGRLRKRQGHEDSKTQSAPELLGRILSLTEYNLSMINSPGMDSKKNSDKPQKNFSYDEIQTRKENKQWLEEERDSHPGQSDKLKTDSCAAVYYPDHNLSSNTNEVTHHITMDDTCRNTKKESKINVRAKKHLSKRLIKSIGHKDPLIQSVPQSLGRMLSLSEDNLLSINSHGHEFTCDDIVDTLTPTTEFSPDADINNAEKDVCQDDSHQVNASHKPTSYSSTEIYGSDDLSEARDSCNSRQVHPLQSPSPSSPSYNNKDDEVEVASTQEEHLFPENDAGHARTIFQPDQGNRSNVSIGIKKPIVEYVNAILRASNLKLDELYMISQLPDHLLDPSLLDDVECCEQLLRDKKLLLDITDDVLLEVHACYFHTSPWVSFVKPGFKPIFDKEKAFAEVWKGVSWYLFELQLPCTPDQIIKEDMDRNTSWLDLRHDAENIGFSMGDAILEELVEDTILSCIQE